MADNKRSVDQKKLEAFNQAMGDIDKKYKKDSATGDTVIGRFGDKPRNVERVSTGSVAFDSINGGGFPKGRIIEIYGPEGSGKTSFSLLTVGNIQKNGGTAAYIDLEHAIDPDYASTLGVDMDNLGFAQPDYAEQALNIMKDLVDSGVVDIVVLDSIGALTTKNQIEGKAEDVTIGTVARLLSKELPKLAIKASQTGTMLIFINQIREKIGVMFGSPETTMGGRAMKFAASQRIDIRKREIIKDENGEPIGNKVRIKVVKNKTGRPGGETHTILTYGQGVNKAAEILEVGVDLGIIEKTSSKTYVEVETGEKITGSGNAKALYEIEHNEALYNRLSKALERAIVEKMNPSKKKEVEESVEDESIEGPVEDTGDKAEEQ